MTAKLLLDTSAFISLLERSQRRHGACVDFFSTWCGVAVVTEAVVMEATHLLGRVPNGARACLDFVLEGGATLVPPTTATLKRCRDLMFKYGDLPMDYADATPVALAEDLGTNLVFTLDRKDFGVYRIQGAGKFDIVPRD